MHPGAATRKRAGGNIGPTSSCLACSDVSGTSVAACTCPLQPPLNRSRKVSAFEAKPPSGSSPYSIPGDNRPLVCTGQSTSDLTTHSSHSLLQSPGPPETSASPLQVVHSCESETFSAKRRRLYARLSCGVFHPTRPPDA